MSTSNTRQRNKQALVRLSDEEHASLSQCAETAGLSLPDYIRSQALGAKPLRAQRRPSVDRTALAKLMGNIGAIGNNVNQIARNLNAERSEDAAFVADTLQAVRQMRDAVLVALGVDPTGGKR